VSFHATLPDRSSERRLAKFEGSLKIVEIETEGTASCSSNLWHLRSDYLYYVQENGSQYTAESGCRSQNQQVHCGLPQGSILSPLLFSLCVEDLPKTSNFIFADDTCLILANKNIDILEMMADQEINKVDS